MGWAIGFDTRWNRDIGYGVPAYCDHPRCHVEIDRGLAYVCGGEAHGGDRGCGLYFCGKHLAGSPQRCPRCLAYKPLYKAPKPDHPTWKAHKATHESWAQWRAENPEEAYALAASLPAVAVSEEGSQADHSREKVDS